MWSMGYIEGLYREYKDLDQVSYIKFKRLQWVGHMQKTLWTVYQKKPWLLTSLAVDQGWDPSFNGRTVYKKMLPDFCGVATGSWLRRIE